MGSELPAGGGGIKMGDAPPESTTVAVNEVLHPNAQKLADEAKGFLAGGRREIGRVIVENVLDETERVLRVCAEHIQAIGGRSIGTGGDGLLSKDGTYRYELIPPSVEIVVSSKDRLREYYTPSVTRITSSTRDGYPVLSVDGVLPPDLDPNVGRTSVEIWRDVHEGEPRLVVEVKHPPNRVATAPRIRLTFDYPDGTPRWASLHYELGDETDVKSGSLK